jgi:ubiquinone/menaquinone biosynthesis C-methylase UbiE
MSQQRVKLKLLPHGSYQGINTDDPIRFYFLPIFGAMYRRRVELCLGECRGGRRVLEIGYGSGVSFLNLHELYDEIYGIDLKASVEAVKSVFDALEIPTFLTNGNVLAMPYEDNYFDTVLLISILEHLHSHELERTFREIHRVLKPGGQLVYGAPVERPLMVFMFRRLGYDIRKAHFSTEKQIAAAAGQLFRREKIIQMKSIPPLFGAVYEVGHFIKANSLESAAGKEIE